MSRASSARLAGGAARARSVAVAAGVLASLAAGCRTRTPAADVRQLPWAEIERQAEGQTVTWMLWQGDPYINAYLRDFVAPRLLGRHRVTLNLVSGHGNRIVSALMTEKEAGQARSEVDLVWINGETFYQLRQIDALYGPFTDRLPGARYVAFDDPFIGRDFQQPLDGYECPWGNVQLAIIYDSARVKEPPRTRAALAAWLARHPGRFTFDSSFTGMTLLKSWLIELAGGAGALDGPFDEEKYQKYSAELWAYLDEIRPYLWRKGETYPSAVSEVHRLYASGEIDFTLSNNDGEVDNKVLQGMLPATSRAYVFDGGTIQNSHYLGVVRNARHVAGALVTINFLISPEPQAEKLKPSVWGDGTVLAVGRLPPPWPARFREAGARRYAPRREEIATRALAELAPEYMIRIYEDFRRHALRP